jgi:hypothetical protein
MDRGPLYMDAGGGQQEASSRLISDFRFLIFDL